MKKISVNKKAKTKVIRDYNNTSRSEKSNANRQKIIEMYVTLLVENNGLDIPLQVLSKKSKTSMRTLFRIFGDKESLNEEIDRYLAQYLTSVSDNLHKMNFSDYAAYSYQVFDQYEKLFKAYLYTSFGQSARVQFRKKFNELLVAKISEELKISPSNEELKKLFFIASLINANIWKDINDSFNLSGQEISGTVKWATQQLLKDIKRSI